MGICLAILEGHLMSVDEILTFISKINNWWSNTDNKSESPWKQSSQHNYFTVLEMLWWNIPNPALEYSWLLL